MMTTGSKCQGLNYVAINFPLKETTKLFTPEAFNFRLLGFKVGFVVDLWANMLIFRWNRDADVVLNQ